MPSQDLLTCLQDATEAEIRTAIDQLSEAEALSILYDWPTWARSDQLIPQGDAWSIWLILSGRGWGKTRTGAETIRHWVESGRYKRFHLVARTAADVRDTMIEGESGILAVSSPQFMPIYQPSKRRIIWPNGATAITFSADTPDALRGPQCDAWWADEVASWRYVQDTWDMLQFGARLGEHVRGIVTTTPRPVKVLKELVKRADVHITRGSTYENFANLAPSFITALKDRYEGTRLGRQEIKGEILEDNPGALWRRDWIEATRVKHAPANLTRVVVAVDPATTSSDDADDTGLVVVGKDYYGEFYVLEDATIHGTPHEWAKAAVSLYEKFSADCIVAESNNGGEMVSYTIETIDHAANVRLVHASRGKAIRAEPVSAKYEQGHVHHVGSLPELEDELCEWTPDDPNLASPNRLDALVWAVTDLMGGGVSVGGGWDVSPD